MFQTYHSILLVISRLDLIDLLVDLCTVVVSLLTSTSDSVLDSGRMPGSDTSNLTKTLVRLPRKFLGVPPGSDACNTKLISINKDDRYKNCLTHKNISQPAKGGEFILL